MKSLYDAWDECCERMESQFHEALDWLGGWEWLKEKYAPAKQLLDQRNRLREQINRQREELVEAIHALAKIDSGYPDPREIAAKFFLWQHERTTRVNSHEAIQANP